MKAGKVLDRQEYWNQAEALGIKIQSFNIQVYDKIRVLNSKDWDDVNPERNVHSPYQTEGNRKFSGSCFWFLFSMVYERHLSYTEWTQLFDLLEGQILSPPTKKVVPSPDIRPSSQLFYGKHPSKRTKSLSRRFEIYSMRSVSNTRERSQYTISDDIGLLQLRIRVSKIKGVSKLEPEHDSQVSNSRKYSQIEEARTEHPSSKKSSSQLITNFYPVIKTECKTEDMLALSPIRSDHLSNKGSPRPSSRKISSFLGAPLSSVHKSVSIDDLIAEFTKEHQEMQSIIKQQLATVKNRAYSEYTENIGRYMTIDKHDFETQNRSAVVGKFPGPIGLIFQNCYKHISCEDEKIFRALRDLTLRLNKKKSKINSRTFSREQQELGAQWIAQKAPNPGSSRTIREPGQQVSKFKGSHSSPQAVQGLASNTPLPRSNLLLEDDKCQVCGDGDYTDSNLIVYCAKCNICTHQLCYGLETLPKGNWICDLCRYYGFDGNGMRCPLCPRVGGIMRRCSLKSNDDHWNKYSPEYLSYMKSATRESPAEPPCLISPDILAFERMTIQGDYKAHLVYDYFGCLTMGVRPPASPRPHLAWLHLCCLPSYTDLRPFTNPIGSDLQSKGHLTTPIQLPELFPTNHKVPWLYREIHPAISDSSTTNTPEAQKQKHYLLPYEQVVQVPNLAVSVVKQERRSISRRSTSTSPKHTETGQRKDGRSLRSRIQREKSTYKTVEENPNAQQSPARKVFVQSPPPNPARIMTSRELRRRSHRELGAGENSSSTMPSLTMNSQIKNLIEDPDQTTLEAYRPEWGQEDQDKVFQTLAKLKGSPAVQQQEILRNLVLPCTCCYISSGFLFSCPKCNRATHGSCGVTAGARRIGDRITCKEHTEDEIFTLLKACQDKNKNEILSWLELDDQCVPMEKAMREIKVISQQIKEIQMQESQNLPPEEPTPKPHHRQQRNKKKPDLEKQTIKRHINQIVITIHKKAATKSGKSVRGDEETSGFRKSTEYFLSNEHPDPYRLDRTSEKISPALSRSELKRSRVSASKSQRVVNESVSAYGIPAAEQSHSKSNSTFQKAGSPLSFSEIADKKTAVRETTRFRLTRDHLNLSLEEIPTQGQTPPRLGLVLDYKQEPMGETQVPVPDAGNAETYVLKFAPILTKMEEASLKELEKSSEQESLPYHPAYLTKSESDQDHLVSDKGQLLEEPPRLGLPISTDVKLKIEESLKLVVEPPSETTSKLVLPSKSKPQSVTKSDALPSTTVRSIEVTPSWQFCPGDSTIKLELQDSSRQVHRVYFKPAYPKTDPTGRPLMKVTLYGGQPKGGHLLFCICARSKRKKPKLKVSKPLPVSVKEPDAETNPQMLAKRTLLIPQIVPGQERVKAEEKTIVPIHFSSLYKTEPQVIPNSSIRSIQRVPFLLDQPQPIGTPQRLTLSLAENREIFRPSSKDWEGMFNSYLRDKETINQRKAKEVAESKSASRTFANRARPPSQKPRPYNYKRSGSRPRGVSHKPKAN